MSSELWFICVAGVAYLILAVIFSLLVNGLLLKFSRTLGSRHDQQRHITRWSSSVKPSVGGFSFYILFLLSLSLYGIFGPAESEYLNRQLLGIVLSVTLGFLIGLADDAYNTYPLLKFSGQLVCGLFLVVTGTMIHASGVFVLDILLTLTWVVGIMNAINMLDNMDGISGSVSLFIVITCLLVLFLSGHITLLYLLMLVGVSGALIGFLSFNWHPARLYMGDTGSQFLGAFLSAVSIPVLWVYHDETTDTFQPAQFLIPAIAFAVPLIDTTTVFIRRIARGQSPFVGGRDHISHHFAYAGLSDKGVIYVLGGASLFSSVICGAILYFGDALNSAVIFYGSPYLISLFAVTQYFYVMGKRKERERTTSQTPESESVAA